MLNVQENQMVAMDDAEIEAVDGGFVCGGLCVLGAIVAGAGLFVTGTSIGGQIEKATR